MDGSCLVMLPPLVILFIGFLTRRVHLSLASGLLVAALLARNGNPIAALSYAAQEILRNFELLTIINPATFWSSWNAFICLFLLLLGVLITLIHHSGGAFAYERFIKGRLKSSRHVETSSLILSSCLCIDDYFSALTVGSVMHPITDSYRIPRAKLAFLVDVMAAPLAILCPVSSWVAAIIGFLRDGGVGEAGAAHTQIVGSPFLAYLNIIPFIFYSFVVVMASWFIVWKGLSFGLMGQHESVARRTGNVFGGREPMVPATVNSVRGSLEGGTLSDFFVPVLVLVFAIFSGILYSGDWQLFGGGRSLAEALRHSRAALGLFVGGVGALGFAVLFYGVRGRLRAAELPHLVAKGVKLMAPSTLVLILAWTLGGILRHDLGTGQYLANLLIGALPPELLPVMFFFASFVIAFAIGSSWGTVAIMFPIAIQMVLATSSLSLPVALDSLTLLFPVLGAVLSGGVAGDHVSPISDTTIMSATSTAMLHSDHVDTQLSYALPLIAVTALSFLCVGQLLEWGRVYAFAASLSFSALLVTGVFSLLQAMHNFRLSRRRAVGSVLGGSAGERVRSS